jgi:hypothetical protein
MTVFDCAERPAVAHVADTAADPPPDRVESRRNHRSAQLIAALLAVVCTSACEASTVSGLRIRAEPTTASRIIGSVGGAGTPVVVDCYVRGESIHGTTLWYRITSPHTGYVTGYYVRTDTGSLAPHAC